jgi:phosphoribosylglycinamide formyltransferase-1
MKTIAIFVSGNGTNCENLIRHFSHSDLAKIALVLSNKSDAFAITRAERLGVPTVVMGKKDFNDKDKLMHVMKEYNIDFIVLAGFLLMIPDFLVQAFHHRMINLHPALLPKFGGKGMFGEHVHEAVKAAGEKETGMTVHWVSNECDGGEIIAQYSVALNSDDSVSDIAAKEHVLEMKYFPSIIEGIIKDA